MNFTKYIDNRFQELKVEEQAIQTKNVDAFPILQDAEMKALHTVLTLYRKFLTWAYVPKVFFGFALVQLRLKKKPGSPLLDKMKADLEAEKKAKQAAIDAGPQLVPSTNVTPLTST